MAWEKPLAGIAITLRLLPDKTWSAEVLRGDGEVRHATGCSSPFQALEKALRLLRRRRESPVPPAKPADPVSRYAPLKRRALRPPLKRDDPEV